MNGDRAPPAATAGTPAHPYDVLTPEAVLGTLDAAGLRTDGRLLQLNSYENRVFQVFLDDSRVVVAKFYRPGRWSDEQILEEHAFAAELAQAEVPVVAPLALEPHGGTLGHAGIDGQPFRFAVYPRRAGQGPELDRADTLQRLGRFIARLHLAGQQRVFAHRRTMDVANFGRMPLERLRSSDDIPPAQHGPWCDACERALQVADEAFAAFGAKGPAALRLHGDCHRGNILWRDEGPHLVDLDDACNGPAIQDLWMMLSGPREAMRSQMAAVLSGYRPMRRFDLRELALIEPLRTLRMIHHSAWLAERWSDPAFPAAFPWFGSSGYWGQQIQQLQEQLAAMAEPPLDLDYLD